MTGKLTEKEAPDEESDNDKQVDASQGTLVAVEIINTRVNPEVGFTLEPDAALDSQVDATILEAHREESQPLLGVGPAEVVSLLQDTGPKGPPAIGAVETATLEAASVVAVAAPAQELVSNTLNAEPQANATELAQDAAVAMASETRLTSEQLTEVATKIEAQIEATAAHHNANSQAAVALQASEQQTSEVAAANVESTPSEEPKTQTNKTGASFASYLFADANSQSAAAPIGDAKLGSLAERELGSEDEESTDKEKTSSENAHESTKTKLDPSPLLTPVDAAHAAASTLPHSLRRHLELQGAVSHTASSTSPVVSDAQQARLLQRVTRAFRMADERGGEVQIRLSPPELGSMKLEMSLSDGVLTAKLEVETQKAQQILLDSLPNLKERLAEQGIRVEKFDVNLPQRDSSGQQSPQQDSQSDRQSRAIAASNRQARDHAPPDTVAVQRPNTDPARLNVIV